MDKVYINSITNESSWKSGNFRLNPYTGYLQYKVEEDLIENITNYNSPDSPAKCSDLYNILESRNFNLVDCKGISKSGELGFISKYDEDGNLMNIEILSNSMNASDENKINSLQSDLLNTQLGYIPTTYIDDGSGDYSSPIRYGLNENYYNFRLIKDLIRDSTVLNVITLSDPFYTDSINLSNIFKNEILENDKISVRLGISYNLANENEIVRIKEIIFPYNLDHQFNVEDLVTIEYLDKKIRLFPNNEVKECIISYCHIIYEH